MFYTGLSRGRTAEGIFLPGFQPKCLIANKRGQAEMERISRESLIQYEHPRLDFFDHFPKRDWKYVSLQNIRSIQSHKDDVLADPIIMGSSIICFTETSLRSDIWPDRKNFQAFNIFQKNRSDAYDTVELQQRKSGGVGLLSDKQFYTSQRKKDITTNLEILSCKTNFPFTEKETYISVIYRDHKLPKHEFLKKMEEVFQAHENNAGLILGDFNFNMMEDDSLYRIAASYGFKPVVSSSTTHQDHLLDQVFISVNMSEETYEVLVLPSYFSDHHLIVLCIRNT